MSFRHRKHVVVFGAVVVAALAGLQWSRAQAPADALREAEIEVRAAEARHMENAHRAAAAQFKRGMVGMEALGRPDAFSEIREAAAALRDAEGETARAEAQSNLNSLLANYFEEDMDRRKAELAEIEDRLTKLREQLDRRRAKKQDIIDLQVKVLINEAEGLGFFNESRPAGTIFGPPGFKWEPQRFDDLFPPQVPRTPAPPRQPSSTRERRATEASPFAEPLAE